MLTHVQRRPRKMILHGAQNVEWPAICRALQHASLVWHTPSASQTHRYLRRADRRLTRDTLGVTCGP